MLHQALQQDRIVPLTRIAEAYIPALFGDGGPLLASLLGPSGRIEDHKFGRLEGPRNAARLPERFRSWLSGWKIQELVHLRTMDAGTRAVSEDIVFATAPDGRKIEWPFATLAKRSVDGRSHELFVYYTIWP